MKAIAVLHPSAESLLQLFLACLGSPMYTALYALEARRIYCTTSQDDLIEV